MPARRRRQTVYTCALLVAMLAGCSPTASDDSTPRVKIAFFQDLSVPQSLDLVSPSFLAFETAMQRALVDTEGIEIEVVQLDTGGDDATAIEMAREVTADPAFTLAVIAPFWSEPPEVARLLAEAGVPTLSLSPESASPWSTASPPPGDPAELWRRFVPDRSAEAALLADTAGLDGSTEGASAICVVTDGSGRSAELAADIVREFDPVVPTQVDGVDADAAAQQLASSRCGPVVWTGFPLEAGELAEAMLERAPEGSSPIDLAGAAMKTIVPLTTAVDHATLVDSVVCPCADVSVRTELDVRMFLNAYQSEHGLAPGAFAVEAWDAADVVATALSSGVPGRAAMRAGFRELASYDGVAGTYIFDIDGELVAGRAEVYTAAGTRWLATAG